MESVSTSQNTVETGPDISLMKKLKSTAKCAFTKARHRLIELIDDQDLPSRREVRSACLTLDEAQEEAIKAINRLWSFFQLNNDMDNLARATGELEILEKEYSEARQSAHDYLESRKDDVSSRASVASSRLSVVSSTRPSVVASTGPRATLPARHPNSADHRPSVTFEDQQSSSEPNVQQSGVDTYYSGSIQNFENSPAASTSIGRDLWKQLKRVSIPVFSGDKRQYAGWKAAFLSCIDQAPATPEYKLLQLRQYVSGDALHAIENLGHSAVAYEVAKERLERKYGGRRREIAIHLEDLENFRPVRADQPRDIEKMADLLDIAVVNLKEAGRVDELGNGTLYTKLQKKLTEPMLARYHRWVFEGRRPESVETLREWINQEAEFATIAHEMISGLTEDKNRGYVAPVKPKAPPYRSHFATNSDKTNTNSNRRRPCPVCGASHSIWTCEKFKEMDTHQRWNAAKQHSLCFRCLGDTHRGISCHRSRTCGIDSCKSTHHRLLHRPFSATTPKVASTSPSRDSSSPGQAEAAPLTEREQTHTAVVSDMTRPDIDYVTLRTVPVILKNGNRELCVNALLDDGSTKTYINADIAAELGLQGTLTRVKISVLNGQVETFETMPVRLRLESVTTPPVDIEISAFTTERVTGNMQTVDWRQHAAKWTHLKDIGFPQLGKRPIVDILIGLDYADLHASIKEVSGKPNQPIARLTPLGWTCVGRPSIQSAEAQTNFVRTYLSRDNDNSTLEDINTTFRQFWQIENCGDETRQVLSINDQVALKTVSESLEYKDRRYYVAIPWKQEGPELPTDNRKMAVNRLLGTEKRLLRQQDVAKSYTETFAMYLEKGYIRKIPDLEARPEKKWYLPHFPVIRPDKSTTKTRIVFDAAARSDGVSLNDTILQGPKLQQDLMNVLLRFRKSPIALACDIAEMYLQIGLAPADRPFHRFLWRDLDQTREPDEYEFTRVVFGVNSSPFQAQYVAQENARKNETIFPRAAETVLKSTYMDDSMDSVDSETDAIELCSQLSQLWSLAGMHARKWLSNSHIVLDSIPPDDRATEIDLDAGHLPSVKTLGVLWESKHDMFGFKLSPPDSEFQFTKRNVLSKVATIFDPLGFLAPYVIRAKILLQEIWESGHDWDDPMDEALTNKAERWFCELAELSEVKIPRCLRLGSDQQGASVDLHAFGDASEDAYGSVIYVRYMYRSGDVSCRMVASKTRVAPLSTVSIPRLELMAAVLSVRLARRVTSALDVPIKHCTFWTDSMNVLWWIRNCSRAFKPFVANRVSFIQGETSPSQWRHVPTDQNPADHASRGLTVSKLADNVLWWSGPKFLLQHSDFWPKSQVEDIATDSEMKTKHKTCVTNVLSNGEKPNSNDDRSIAKTEWRLNPIRFSNWLRLKRQTALVLRFVESCRLPTKLRRIGPLSPEEILDAEVKILRDAQQEGFPEETRSLAANRPLPTSSRILGLSPKLGDDGIMRMDGRLKYAEFLPYDVRHPIILPRKNWVTQLVVRHYHALGFHTSGTNHTLAEISTRYWITASREAIRECEKSCAECTLRKSKAGRQIMAPLPPIRLRCSLRAFSRSAVDYGGPFLTIQGRGKVRAKRYLCLFTCLESRAVHLEMAYSLETDGFLNAFFRMVNRRGLPEEMSSDNGTNFVGAANELRSLVDQIDHEKVQNATGAVKWHFNPPLAPHFGGVHETMIKSAKRAIYAILQNADINDEELLTAFTGAEALLNSRPLTYQTSHPADDTPLTPNHFLHGQAGGKFAPESVDSTQFSPRKRWRHVQGLVRHFWHRWMREWLPSLSVRKKWLHPQNNFKVDDVVLVISSDTPRGQWPLGRIIDVHPGKDGHVRVATVRVGKSVYVRSISRLCPVECG